MQALDLVDNDLLADMEAIDLSILGELRLNKIDYICADITSLTGGFVWSIGKGLLGDLGDMDFSAIKNKSRSQGDVQMILNVLSLVGNDNNSNILSKAAYGIGTDNGISLGLNISNNDLLADMEAIDLSILGELRLNKIDYICADITSLTGGFVWSIGKGLLGDLGDMDFSPIKDKSRSQGDFQMILNVLALVGNDNNSNILSKAAYGIGTDNGISLGLNISNNDLLADMKAIDLSILGELRLNKIDYICADITSLTGGFVWSIGKGLLGDLGDMDFSPIKDKSRSQGDVQMITSILPCTLWIIR